MKDYKEIIEEQGLKDLYNYIKLRKNISMEELEEKIDYISNFELILDCGALYCLGLILIKLGNPIRIMALREEDAQYRFDRSFK